MNGIKTSLVGFLVTICFTAYTQTNWKNYDLSLCNFRIDFLQDPGFSTDSSIFNDTLLISYFWELNVDDTLHLNNYYSVSCVHYPSDFIHSDSLFSVVEGFINSTQNSILDDDTFTLLSSSLLEKNGYPGKVFKWKNIESGIFFEFQVFLVQNRLFQLSVVSKEGENHNKYINQYFDSFKIVGIPKGKFVLPTNSNERTYSIIFPEEQKEENRTIDSEYGKLNLNIQILEPKSKNDNMVYVAMETKYPSRAVDQNNTYELNTFYKNLIDGSLNSVNGELISINDIFYNRKLGKEYRSYISEGTALMVYRVYYIDDKLYSFGIITLPEKDKNREMTKFFDSFIIDK